MGLILAQYGDQIIIYMMFMLLRSKSFGEAVITYEIGKKEDRNGDGNITTMGDFLKVHTH